MTSLMTKPQPPRLSIEENSPLSLACSSSIPPSVVRRYQQGFLRNDGKASEESIFITNCCRRPICPSCISANPRLMRSDPCLHRLGGVDVVASGMVSSSKSSMVMDQDPFVIGDDDDSQEPFSEAVPPPYEEVAQNECQRTEAINAEVQDDMLIEPNQQNPDPIPIKYYLTSSDTLLGIALRYGMNVGNNNILLRRRNY